MKKGIITIVVVLLVAIILVAAFSLNEKNNAEKEKINSYKQIVEEYLNDIYDDEFDVEFVRKGYKQEKLKIGSRDIKNIREYVYEFSKQEEYCELSAYVVFWYNTDLDTYEINPYIENKNDYEEILDDYNKKVELSGALEKAVSNLFGDDYEIELNVLEHDSRTSMINILTTRSIPDLIKSDLEKVKKMYNEVKDLLVAKELEAHVIGEGCSFFITKDYSFETDDTIYSLITFEERKKVKEDISECLDKYYKNKYSINMHDANSFITIEFSDSLFDMGKDSEKFIGMFNEIASILQDTQVTVRLSSKVDFSDLTITGESSAENDFSLDFIINYYSNKN